MKHRKKHGREDNTSEQRQSIWRRAHESSTKSFPGKDFAKAAAVALVIWGVVFTYSGIRKEITERKTAEKSAVCSELRRELAGDQDQLRLRILKEIESGEFDPSNIFDPETKKRKKEIRKKMKELECPIMEWEYQGY